MADRSAALFELTDLTELGRALHELHGPLIGEIQSNLTDALHGSLEGTVRYVRAYRQLATTLVDEVAQHRPGALHDSARAVAAAALQSTAADVPLVAWSPDRDLADGVVLALNDRVRRVAGLSTLVLEIAPLPASEDVDAIAVERFLRRVRHLLNQPVDEVPLQRAMRVFGLSKTELGRLFGVSRQAIDSWLEKGVPADRHEKLATLSAVADLLERKLKADRIPGVARRAAEAYGGRTMLDLVAADRHRELLELVHGSFAWSEAA